MSKNILELLKDKIRDYENNDKTDQLEVTKSLFNEKCKFALALADQIIRWVCVATVRDKPFKERAAVLAPALGKGKKLPKELWCWRISVNLQYSKNIVQTYCCQLPHMFEPFG